MEENKEKLRKLALEVDERNKDLGTPLAQELRAALDQNDMAFIELVCSVAANDVRRDIAALSAIESEGPSCSFIAPDDGKKYYIFDSQGGVSRCYQAGDLSQKEYFFRDGVRERNGLAFLSAKWA
ncbi:hypothetical protein [Falsigemmobacter faecalis]|uniref:Uncharacterized protein n=1 Tax=Falsigemmobacter faecalis TaxID=2488730 RepID=A0A3P3D2R4_9RHOB|nr:hypothetical protein [Falsigemmobacter faecalis]RRH68361.1 hypothetical protein EG244_19400 [Falsigemmobacter faecalis]